MLNHEFYSSFSQGFDLPEVGLQLRNDVLGYATVDLASRYKITPKDTLTAGVQNLFDRYYFPLYSQLLRSGSNNSRLSAAGHTLSITYQHRWQGRAKAGRSAGRRGQCALSFHHSAKEIPMGLLDSFVGSVLGSHPAGDAPGARLGPLAAVLGPMLASTNNPLGGLPGLLHRFEQGGLGHLAASWVGTGPNLPVSGAQVHDALGGDLLAGLATRFGTDPAQLQALLAQWLPVLVDKLTPQGVLPADSAASGTSHDLLASLGSLLQKQ